MDDDRRRARHACAVLWMAVLALAIAGSVYALPAAQLLAFSGALVMTIVTAVAAKLARDERLAHPLAVRVAAGSLLAVALAGSAIALAPGATDTAQIDGVYFLIVAVVAYRAVAVPAARRALLAVAVAIWAWIPFGLLTLIGCKWPHVPHWTQVVSRLSVRACLLVVALLAIVALLAFVPRRDAMPDARVVR